VLRRELEQDASDREHEQVASYQVASWLTGERELADRGTRAGWTSDASCSDANGKLRTSRIRNALGLELIGWMQAGTRAGAD